MLSQLGYMQYDMDTMERSVSFKYDEVHKYGPFWLGPLHDQEFLRNVDPTGMAMEKRCRKYLDLWINELDSEVFVYDVSELSSHLKMSPPRMADLLDTLNSHGKASMTHMSPTSFKTDLPLESVKELFIESSPDRE